MDKPIRFTWELYTGKIEQILLLVVCTTIPLLLIHSFATNYIYAITPQLTPLYSFGDIYYALLTILLYLWAQVPFIRLAYNEYVGEEKGVGDALLQFMLQGFTVFVFAVITAVVTTIGFMLFIIPGLLLLSIAFPIPYVTMFDGKPIHKSLREGFRLGRKHLLKIFGLLTFVGFVELVVGILITLWIFNITSSFAAQMVTQMALNVIIFPFFIILMSSFMIKWREGQRVIEVESQEA
ncbi:hypothetical protein [Pontibacillus salipaludis]|uniref:Glycerophosphoryl diester phosphodiesterase membrane domain-containing protein n=1 Tax=Pontibacillus salipaludis TaxID=1697394 RepID=A0ABQ1QB82_9BACI|nr:hypothetical protein [Pontibacillus salipaludis]GGD20295.1 hypothetical protein GCM10011389_29930 [Pontibacillus salipaludis]